MKRILFFLPNLQHGGAESVLVAVGNYLTKHGFEVIFVLAKAEGALLSNVNSDIKIVNLNLRSQRLALVKLPIAILRNSPDYILSTMKESNFLAILSRLISFSRAKVIIREANTVSQQIAHETAWYRRLKNAVIFHFYKYADQIIALSDPMKLDLQRVAPCIPNNKITVIANPVDYEQMADLAQEPINTYELSLIKNRPLFLSVGRLHEQKNYGFLLDALAEYRNQGNEFTFFALGEGALYDELTAKSKSLQLDDCCFFLGYRANPYKYMRNADIFLLPSLYEGMSNSLIQAIALNMKVLVADSQPTSVDLVENYALGQTYRSNAILDFVSALQKSLSLSASTHKPHIAGIDSLERYLQLINNS